MLSSTGDQVVAHQTATASADNAARAKAETRPPRTKPRRDRVAAQLVSGSWEPRRRNRWYNHHTPARRALRYFRHHTMLPRRYRRHVTGDYQGTTDQILQWAAYKWGFAPDVLRGVATLESWWNQTVIGDHGRSFGLMQMKRGHHCCFPTSRLSTAFNVDYYGAYVRWIYDGRARWLRRLPHNGRYQRGELWRSVATWYSGRWREGNGWYAKRVKRIVRRRVWRSRPFRYG